VRDRGGRSGAEEGGRGLLQTAVISFTSGGLAASRSSGLAADLLGFWGGKRVRTEGFIWAWLRGRGAKRIVPNRSSSRRSRSGVHHVRSGLFGRDDKWDPEVSDRRRGCSIPIRGGR
jgi:hypothetical protein